MTAIDLQTIGSDRVECKTGLSCCRFEVGFAVLVSSSPSISKNSSVPESILTLGPRAATIWGNRMDSLSLLLKICRREDTGATISN